MRELEDRSWFPQWLRQHQTDFLRTLAETVPVYAPVKPDLENLMQHREYPGWTDLCSGSGGPVISLHAHHAVVLTDLFPPPQGTLQLPPAISYHPHPVNALEEKIPGAGMVTMFNSFHHFSQRAQITLLGKIADSHRPLLIAEILQPSIICLLKVLVTTTIGHWMLVPFMKPFSLRRLFFTYILPLHTLTVCFDGIISVFKSKPLQYYKQLLSAHTQPGYSFDVFIRKGPFASIICITGHYKNA